MLGKVLKLIELRRIVLLGMTCLNGRVFRWNYYILSAIAFENFLRHFTLFLAQFQGLILRYVGLPRESVRSVIFFFTKAYRTVSF